MHKFYHSKKMAATRCARNRVALALTTLGIIIGAGGGGHRHDGDRPKGVGPRPSARTIAS